MQVRVFKRMGAKKRQHLVRQTSTLLVSKI